jgi:hypothetical protein
MAGVLTQVLVGEQGESSPIRKLSGAPLRKFRDTPLFDSNVVAKATSRRVFWLRPERSTHLAGTEPTACGNRSVRL